MGDEENFEIGYQEYTFEIERIMDKRINPRNGKQEYLVQWKLWPEDHTWEPKKNIQDFLSKSDKFHSQDEDICKRNNNMKRREKEQYKEKSYGTKESSSKETYKVNEKQSVYNKNAMISSESEEDSDSEIRDILKKHTSYSYEQNEQFSKNKHEMNYDRQQLDLQDEDDLEEQDMFDKILDRKEVNNQVSYLIQFQNNKQPKWMVKEQLSDFLFEIISFENQMKPQMQNLQPITTKQEYVKQQTSKTMPLISTNSNQKVFSYRDNEEYESLETSSSTEKAHLLQNSKTLMKQDLSENVKNSHQQNLDNIFEDGNFKSENVQEIDLEIKYTYIVHWKNRLDGNIPSPKVIHFVKRSQISPEELIEQVYTLNYNQQQNTEENK